LRSKKLSGVNDVCTVILSVRTGAMGAGIAGRRRGPAFVNGALVAPGANKDSSTVPAKFSAKNDAEDPLPLTAFTFKNLSDEQRHVIVQSVKDAKTAAPNGATNPDFARHAVRGSEVMG
jgi:hypothetical protein